jgi:hypothetical protein
MTHRHRHHLRRHLRRHFEARDRLEWLESHRRDVEEYLADLSERIRREQERRGVSSTPSASPEAAPEPS